jgi:hypothetical protein
MSNETHVEMERKECPTCGWSHWHPVGRELSGESQLASARARVRELEARVNEIGPAYTGALMQVRELEERVEAAYALSAQYQIDASEQLRALREAVDVVMPWLKEMQSLYEQDRLWLEERDRNMCAMNAAIERLKIARGA